MTAYAGFLFLTSTMSLITTLFATISLLANTTTVPVDAVKAPEPVIVFATDATENASGPEQAQATSAGAVVTVTAYTSEPRQTDDTPCISADNSDICVKYAEGEKICATNDHAMHSKLYIPGYGICTVRDRMNKRYTGTGRVDIYLGMDTAGAYQWGARRVSVTKL